VRVNWQAGERTENKRLTGCAGREIVALLQGESGPNDTHNEVVRFPQDWSVAVNIVHFGQELSYCFPFLRKAGYSIDRYERILDFRGALQSGRHDAVSLCDLEDEVSRIVVLAARTHSPAPLILFRKGTVIPFQAGKREPAEIEEKARPGVDLVISSAASPWTWLSDLDRLMARNRELLDQSRRIRQMSVVLCEEAAAAGEKCRLEQARGKSELARNALLMAALPSADKVLMCGVCGEEFVFTIGEQLFFRLHNFVNDPKHCKRCRPARRNGVFGPRQETAVTCAECGAATTVPFKPFRGQPVLCRACFEKVEKAE